MDYGSKEVGGSKLKKKKLQKIYLLCRTVSQQGLDEYCVGSGFGRLFIFRCCFFLILKPSIKPSVQVT